MPPESVFPVDNQRNFINSAIIDFLLESLTENEKLSIATATKIPLSFFKLKKKGDFFMPDIFSAFEAILGNLERTFPGRTAISRPELRTLLGISVSTDARLRKAGVYPKLLVFWDGPQQESRILLTDLADWLASLPRREGGLRGVMLPSGKKKGRPVGSKNKPKNIDPDPSAADALESGSLPL